ncbi:MAG TPA: hypothetical protein DEA05_07760 [Rhodobacteraceae bacterium]|nr:hypothetical protein [Paracoccaceae bacterium]
MIGLRRLQVVPAFSFSLPANTPARAATPEETEGWLSVHDRLWVRRETDLRRPVTSGKNGTVGKVAISQPGWVLETTEDEGFGTLVEAAAKNLMADALASIRDQLAASVPDVVLGGLNSADGFPALDWPAGRGGSRDGQRQINRARLEALRTQAEALAAKPVPGAGELSDDPLAGMLSRRLCEAFARIRSPAPATVYVRPDAGAIEAQIEWVTAGDFDVLWGARYLEVKSGRVQGREWAGRTMERRRNLGMARHLLAMASAFERAFGGCDTLLRFGMQIAAPGFGHRARLTVAPSAWGFDLAATASLSAVSALPEGLDLSVTSRPVDPAGD